MRHKITLFIIFLFSVSFAVAQNINISGTVSDVNGVTLPGVTVKVKGTTQGTQTDLKGHYAFSVPSNATLIFSFIGFSTEERTVIGQKVINVQLTANSKDLNEVVVIGYGTQKKATVTGAISGVSAKDLDGQQVTSFSNALEGRAAGVLVTQNSGAPGSGPSVMIRGIGSLSTGAVGPLYVIDGAIWDNGGYDAINPNDIESIQVLKDASAAIYGSRSSNGVILITTKQGKAGKAKVAYDFYYGNQSVSKKIKLANATQYAQLYNQALANDGTAPFFTNPQQYGKGTDWQNVIFGNAPIMDHHLSVSGGNETANYFTALGYLDQKGIVTPDFSNYKKFNLRANTNYHPKKYLKFGENFNYTYVRTTTAFNTNNVFGGPLADAVNMDPITPVVVNDVSAQPNPNDYTSPYIIRNAQGLPYGISPYAANEIVNPLAAARTINGNYNWSHNIFANAFAEIDPIPGLAIKSSINAKQAFYGSESFSPMFYLNVSNKNLSQNSQYRGMNQNLEWNWDNTISYTRSIQKHNFNVLFGQSSEKESGYGTSISYNGEPISNYQNASFNFSLPQTQRLGSAYDNQIVTHASLFGRVTYDYDQKYLLQAILRHDGSSKFGSNNVYGNFPSISAGWVVTKESWFPSGTFVDYLKIRGSWGILGNESALSPFQYSPIVGPIGSYIFGSGTTETLSPGYGPNSSPNASLQWEQDKQTDIAIDATLFHDFTLTLDYYNKNTNKLLVSVAPPNYVGITGNAFQNAGGISNKGFEVQLGYNKKVGDVTLNLSGNISYNKNKVTSLGNQPAQYVGSWQGASPSQLQIVQVGQPFYEFYGYKVIGIFQSQAEVNAYKDASGQLYEPNAKPGDLKYAVNGAGALGPNDRQYLGSPIPTWSYGYTFNAAYKQFDVNIFGQGVWGNKIFQEYRRLDLSMSNYPSAALNAWTPTNTNTNYPRLTVADPNKNFSQPSSFYLQSGAYMRIKTIQLGYNFSKGVLNKLDISKLRVYVSGDNLFTITKYTGFDPEVSGGANNYFGVDQGVYPTAKTIRIGLDVVL